MSESIQNLILYARLIAQMIEDEYEVDKALLADFRTMIQRAEDEHKAPGAVPARRQA